MFCFKCGANIPDESRFCPKCGAAQPAGSAGSVNQERASRRDDNSEFVRRTEPELPGSTSSAGQSLNSPSPFANVTLKCHKCGASTSVVAPVCLSCGATLDLIARFKTMKSAAEQMKMPMKDLQPHLKAAGVVSKGKGCGPAGILMWAVFWWFIGTTAFATGAPGTLAWTAPITCAEGYTDVVIPVSTSSFQGRTTMTASMYCIDKDGFAVEAEWYKAYPAVGLFFAAGSFAPLLLLFLIGALRRMRHSMAGGPMGPDNGTGSLHRRRS